MALIGNSNEEKIWNYLKAAGLNDYGVAGLMGNLYAESALCPDNLQNTYEKKLGVTDAEYVAAVDAGTQDFIHDAAGFGLAQWTYWSRKQNLLNYAKEQGKSIADLEMQLGFLIKELTGYSTVMNTLKTATTVKAASDIVLVSYERPADQSEAAKARRENYGLEYFKKFAGTQAPAAEPEKEKETRMEVAITLGSKIETGVQLAATCLVVAQQFKTLYVMGCFGAPMTEANKTKYCNNHTYNMAADRTAMIKAATDDTFGFDCVCLIKGLLWGWSGNKSKTYGGAGYACNGVPDIGADQMIKVCNDVSTDFSKIEVGEAVWTEGHIGVYVGGGLAVECTPRWNNCVQVTACNRDVSGYNRRDWKKHGKLPYISYTGDTDLPAEESADTVKKSDAEIAKEVIAGKWGNGDARKKALTAAGYDYAAVQAIVNELVAGTAEPVKKDVNVVADEVIMGKWGNGDARKKALTAAGYNYEEVQAAVNKKIAQQNAKKSDEEIAKEVIAGKWGNGDARKKALTAAGYDYAAVQAIVNKML